MLPTDELIKLSDADIMAHLSGEYMEIPDAVDLALKLSKNHEIYVIADDDGEYSIKYFTKEELLDGSLIEITVSLEKDSLIYYTGVHFKDDDNSDDYVDNRVWAPLHVLCHIDDADSHLYDLLDYCRSFLNHNLPEHKNLLASKMREALHTIENLTDSPCCPECGWFPNYENLKSCSTEDGHLIENYHCICGERYTVRYDGRTSDSDWEYVEDQD